MLSLRAFHWCVYEGDLRAAGGISRLLGSSFPLEILQKMSLNPELKSCRLVPF